MANQSIVLDAYLESLLKNKTPEVQNQLLNQVLNFSQALVSDQNIWVFLNSPLMSTDEKNSFLNNFAQRLNVDIPVLNMFVLLSKNKRLNHVGALQELSKEYQDRINNIAKIKMVSSVEVTDEIKKKLIKKLETLGYANIELSYTIDDSLIAGFKLLTGNNEYDLSLKSVCNEFQQTLLKTN